MNKIRMYTTNQTEVFQEQELELKTGVIDELFRINMYPNVKKQKIIGFGGAFTEASAYTLKQMSHENREKVLDLYFGKDGNRYNLCRTHIQSCDFSLNNYAYIEDEKDQELNSFSIERDKKYIIPMIHDAQKRNKEIKFIASPWSPPAFMKSNNNMNLGGKLLPEYMEMWANMIVRYLKEYKREGIYIERITVQNEPEATQSWDSCTYTAMEESNFVVDYLAPILKKSGFEAIKIFIWDHNKEAMVDRVLECMKVPGAMEAVDGVAFHWYTGDHFDSIWITHELFPNKELIFTEGCVEYSRFSGTSQIETAEMYAHDLLGNLNAGMNGYIDWNMVLDKNGGPNHVGNFCEAPIMCDIEEDMVNVNLSFFYIGHFSRFVLPGAVRIATTKYMDELEVTAFMNLDGSIVLIILNRADRNIPIHVKMENKVCVAEVKLHSINTLIWK